MDREDETAPSEHAGAAPAHMPGAADPEGPPDLVALAPAYPPPTGPAHGREYSSDEDGDGPYGTEAGDANYPRRVRCPIDIGALEAYAESAAGARGTRQDRHLFATQTHHDVVWAFLPRVRPGPDQRTGCVDHTS